MSEVAGPAGGAPHRLPEGDVAAAREIMDAFSRRTGVEGDRPPRRYLWTDAFAVCVDLGLHEATGEARHLERALRLVDQVHRVLGRFRRDDFRSGWISGLSEKEGEAHPTAGGLRIGKPMPERRPGEREDPKEEWDRDGQYFHYLTRWMHALRRVAAASGQTRYLTWAVELARAAFRGFYHDGTEGAGLFWKASTDLARPLVATQGHHDPLDGYVTLLALRADVVAASDQDPVPDTLRHELGHLARLCDGDSWTTADPLGLGALLEHAARLTRLRGLPLPLREPADPASLQPRRLLEEAGMGLQVFSQSPSLLAGPERRLAFRELGLVVGLRALESLEETHPGLVADARLPDEDGRHRLRGSLQGMWMEPASQSWASWNDHEDINAVTLAATLVPTQVLA